MGAVTQRFRGLAWLLGGLALSLGAVDVRAQSIDYSSFERLFGEPVTMSATGSPQRVSDAPVTMDIITADQIRSSGAYDLPGVLRQVVGVDVLQWSNDHADVGIRGYNQSGSARVLVLIDGRQVYADYYGFTPWSALPVELSAIRQIEVIKGPNCALFGFNAVGGVINIITSNPLYDQINAISVATGTQGLIQGSAVGTARLGERAGLRIELGGRSNQDFSSAAPVFFNEVRRGDYRDSVNLDGVVRPAPGVELDVEATHAESRDPQNTSAWSPAYTHYLTDSLKGQLLADTPVGLLRATAYSNWVDGQYLFARDVVNSALSPEYHSRTSVAQLEDIAKLDANDTVRVALELRQSIVNTSPVTGAAVLYDVSSASGMWERKITHALSFTMALRMDRLFMDRDGPTPPAYPFTGEDWGRHLTAVSFNTGFVWHATERDTLRLRVDRGAKLPNLVDGGAALVQYGPVYYTGVPTLEPSITTNYEVGWDHTLPSLGASAHARVYHESTTQVESVDGGVAQAGSQLYLTPANIGSSHATGTELSVTGGFAQFWRWSAGYAGMIISDHFRAQPVVDYFVTDFARSTPRNVLTGSLGWTRGAWEIDGFLRYESLSHGQGLTDLTTAPVLESIPAHLSFDGRIGYRFTEALTVAISGQNLVPRYQRQTAGVDVERRVIVTLSAQL
ncbi:MAG TPA: TonB-dependent receptor [Steroidobacteraceae bacterium]